MTKKLLFVSTFFSLFGAARAQFTYTEDFRTNTAAGWNFYQGTSGTSPGPRLTSGATTTSSDPESTTTIDASGQGWLRLATNTTNQANGVYFDTPIPSAGNKVSITFNVNMWGGNNFNGTGADGLTFFLYDASTAFSPGAFGGSLGYAQKSGISGLSGGFVGVALDAYGNYSNPTEGRSGGVGFSPNSIVIRGPGNGGSGYDYLAGTTGSNGTQGINYTSSGSPTSADAGDSIVPTLPYTMAYASATSRPNQTTQYRKIEFTLDENSQVTVRIQFGEDGLWYTALSADLSSFVRPEQLRLGFSAGTGDGTQVYEVGGMLQITATAGSGNFIWDNDRGSSFRIWGTGASDPLNWYGNTNPTLKSNVLFNSAYISEAQSIDVTGSDKVVRNLYFAGKNAYSLYTSESRKIIFDNDTVGGLTTISLTEDSAGNANHTVGLALQLNRSLDINNNLPTANVFTISGDVDTNGNILTSKGVGQTVFSGAITGGGTLVKSDVGITKITGSSANTYTGQTTVQGGILQIEKASALGSTATGTTVNSGGTLALAGSGTSFAAESLSIEGTGFENKGALRNISGANAWTGALALTSSASVGVDTGSSLNISSVISGTSTSTLTKVGDGTLTLSGANTYAGATAIQGGTLSIGADSALGTAPGSATANQLSIDGGTLNTSASFTLNANRGLNFGSNGATISTDSGTTLSYGGIASGAGDLTKTGAGTLLFSGANTYSGATNINQGTIQLGANNALPSSSAVTVGSAATLNLNNYSTTVGSIAGTGSTLLGSGTLTAGGNNTSTTYSGTVAGTGTLQKAGTGNLTLSGGTNSFASGTLQVSGGTVTMGASNLFADTGTTLKLSGGTFKVGGNYSDTIANLSVSASSGLDYGNNTSTLTFTDATRSAGTLTVYNWAGDFSGGGSSQLVFSNAAGTFNTSSDIVFDGYAAGYTRLATGEIVPNTGGIIYTWTSDSNNAWGTDANWSPDPTLTGVGPNGTGVTTIFGGAISANRTVTVSGTKILGYMVFNDNNQYSITGGTLNLDVTGGLAQINVMNSGGGSIASAITLSDALKINQNSSSTFTISGGISNATGANSITVTGSGNTTLSGNITTGSGGITMNGTGTLTLSGANTYTGKTVVNNGTLAIDAENRLGNNPASYAADQLTLNGGTLSTGTTFSINDGNRGISLGANGGTFQTTAGTLTLSNTVSGSGGLIKSGAGTLTLSNTGNSYAGGSDILAGTLTLGASNVLPNTTAVNIASGAMLNMNNFSDTIGSLSGEAGAIVRLSGTGTSVLTVGDTTNTVYAGVIEDTGTGKINLTKQGSGSLTLSGSNTFDGNINVNAGTLVAANNNALGSTTGSTTVATGATLALQGGISLGGQTIALTASNAPTKASLASYSGNNSISGAISLNAATSGYTAIMDTAAGSQLSLSGVISNPSYRANLEKTGTGTLVLSGANTFTGTTQIDEGILVAANTSALGTTNRGTTVASGATLGLQGGINFNTGEALTISGTGYNSQGALRNMSGTNTFTGSVTLAGESFIGTDSGSQLTLSGTVSDGAYSYGLTKVGTGALVLSGANDFSSATSVQEGTLVVANSSALGVANTTTVLSGASLQLSGNGLSLAEKFTIAGSGVSGAGVLQNSGGNNSTSGQVTLVGNSIISSTSGTTLTLSGSIGSSDSYDLIKADEGGLTLAGNNTFTGKTILRGGTLTLSSSAQNGSNGSLGNNSSTVQVGDSSTSSSSNLSLLLGPGSGIDVGHAISVNNYGSTVTMGGTNTSGTNLFSGNVSLAKNTTFTAATGGIVAFTGDVSGAGAITKTDNGTVVLAGNNTYTGALNVNGGAVVAASNNALGTGAGSTIVSSGATLGLTGGITIPSSESIAISGTGYNGSGALYNISGNNTVSGPLSLTGASTITSASAGDTLTLSGGVSGAYGLTTSGSGNITITGAGSLSGGVSVNGTSGAMTTLANTSGQALGNVSSISVASGNILALGASNQINDAATLTLSGGTFQLAGYSETMRQLTQTSASTIDYLNDGGVLRFNGVTGSLSGLGSISGTLTIDNWAGSLAGAGSEQFVVYSSTGAAPSVTNISFSGWGAATTIARSDLGTGYFEIIPASAGTRWNVNGNGNWAVNGNWQPNSGYPNAVGAVALFGNVNGTLNTNPNVSLQGTSRTVGKVIFDTTGSSYGYTISSTGGNLILDVASGTAQVIVNDDSAHTISAGVVMNDATTITNNSTNATGLKLSGAISTSFGAAGNLSVSGAGTTQITSAITQGANTVSLLKSGSGTLILGDVGTTVASTFTGATTIQSGTLQLNASAPSGVNGVLGNSTSAIQLNTSSTAGSANTALLLGYNNVSVARNINISNYGNTTTLGGNMSSGTGSFTGAIATAKDVTLSAAGTSSISFSGAISGTGSLTKTGTGTVVFSGTSANTVTGDLNINEGTLDFAKTTANTNVADTNTVNVGSSGTLKLSGGVAETIGALSGSGTVNNSSATAVTLTTGANNASTAYSGLITDTGAALSIAKTGTGTFTLSGANSFDGAVTVSGGTLVAANNSALGTTTGNTTVAAGATLALQGGAGSLNIAGEQVTLTASTSPSTASLSNLSGTNTMTGNIQIAGATANDDVKIDVSSGSQLSLSGVLSQVSNTKDIAKSGDGTLILSGANTFTGTTNITAGTLIASNASALGTSSGSTYVQIGGTLGIQGGITISNEPLVLNGSNSPSVAALKNVGDSNAYTGTITLSGSAGTGVIMDAAAGSLDVSGTVSQSTNSNFVTKTGTGTITFSGTTANTYTGGANLNDGTTILAKTAGLNALGTGNIVLGDNVGSAGSAVLQLNASNQISDTSNVTINTDGTMALQGNSEAIKALTMSGGTVTGSGTLTLGGNMTFNGVGANTASISSNVDLGGDRIFQVGNNGLNGDNDLTISGTISGSGVFTKSDLGTLAITGSTSNTFTGGMAINDGTVILQKSSGSATGTGSITVGDNAGLNATLQLGASNQISDSAKVTIRSEGVFNVGAQSEVIGSLASTGGTLTIASGGTLYAGGDNTTNSFTGSMTGAGTLIKQGTGTLTIASAVNFASGTIQVDAGTLEFTSGASGATIGTIVLANGTSLKLGTGGNGTYNITNLTVTGATTIDFGSGSYVTLNSGTFSIATDVATGGVKVTNWTQGYDWFLTSNSSSGWTNATLTPTGQPASNTPPMNQVQFSGGGNVWDPSSTAWVNFDSSHRQICPVPEPSTYGAIFSSLSFLAVLFRKFRRKKKN